MKHLLIVEDERNLLDSLSEYLKEEGYEVSCTTSLKEGREWLKVNSKPDLAILDWMLPDGQGIELLNEWKKNQHSFPILFLTARTSLIDKVLALEVGAVDYMTKPFEPRELLARIRAHLRERESAEFYSENKPENRREDDLLEVQGIRMCLATRNVSYEGKSIELKRMEFSLLKLFLENPGQVFSRDELLNKVWGYESFPTTRTIDTHILQLRQKFSSDLFETIRGIGYRLKELAN